ncbi:hypothetical protein TWF730_010495 [Orbilia blumenaviensis]|uniref:Uncharacterized protein n=1 Tax=Orbilia blumenaviensis TaxID=1796055 RepID=A0AAV9UNF6_9PEZI
MRHPYLLAIVFIFSNPIYSAFAYLINFQRSQYPQTLEDEQYLTQTPSDRSCMSIHGDHDSDVLSIRVRSDESIGGPPQAMAFFTEDGCSEASIAYIVRFYQLSDSMEQSISPFEVGQELTQGPGWDNTMQAQSSYNYYENIGYTSALWGAVVGLNLQPGDMALNYTSADSSGVTEWRIAEGVVAVEESPNTLQEGLTMAHDHLEPMLSTSLPSMPKEERKLIQNHFQALARESPASEESLLTTTEYLDPESAWRDDFVRGHERKIKIGKLARERNQYGPTPVRKANPNMIELNPLVNLPGQSHLQDLENQKALTAEDYLNDKDWDLYLPDY